MVGSLGLIDLLELPTILLGLLQLLLVPLDMLLGLELAPPSGRPLLVHHLLLSNNTIHNTKQTLHSNDHAYTNGDSPVFTHPHSTNSRVSKVDNAAASATTTLTPLVASSLNLLSAIFAKSTHYPPSSSSRIKFLTEGILAFPLKSNRYPPCDSSHCGLRPLRTEMRSRLLGWEWS